METIPIYFSDDEIARLDTLAREQSLTHRQIIRDALSYYILTIEWRMLRTVGNQIAKKLTIHSDDDVERIFG